MIVTGFVGEGSTFIHDLKDELLIASAMLETVALTMALAVDGAMPTEAVATDSVVPLPERRSGS
jgi:hypothetical protein